MAKLYISEYRLDVYDSPYPAEPVLADQTVAIGGASTQSAAFSANTRLIRIHSDAVCSVAVGANPTATATNARLAIGADRPLRVQPGHKIAVITNT